MSGVVHAAGTPPCNPSDPACAVVQQQTGANEGKPIAQIEAEAGFEPVDEKSVTELPVECQKIAKTQFGIPACEKFFATAEKYTREALGLETTNIYKGVTTNFAAGVNGLSATPVCNLSDGEKDKNFLTESKGCGRFCGYTIETGWFSGSLNPDKKVGDCEKEYSWYRGAYVQILNFYKERVFKEFRAKNVQLVNVNGAYPCQAAGAHVLTVQRGIVKFENTVIDTIGREEAGALQCPDGNASGNGMDSNTNNPVAHGACKSKFASMDFASQVAKFLGCEIRWRATKVMEDEFSDQDKWMKMAKAYIKPLCKGAARCKNESGQVDLGGNIFCTDGQRTKLFNACYKAHFPDFVKQKLSPFRTTEPIEKKLPNTSDAGGLWAFALGALVRARSRSRKGWRSFSRLKALWPLIAIVLIVSLASSGCDGCDSGSGDEFTQCVPCNGGTSLNLGQQNQGCVYKSCLAALFVCISPESKQEYQGASDKQGFKKGCEAVCFGLSDAYTTEMRNVAKLRAMQDFQVRGEILEFTLPECKDGRIKRDTIPHSSFNFERSPRLFDTKNSYAAFLSEMLIANAHAEAPGDENFGDGSIAGDYHTHAYPDRGIPALALKVISLKEAVTFCRSLAGLPNPPAENESKTQEMEDSQRQYTGDTTGAHALSEDEKRALNQAVGQVAELTGQDASCRHVQAGQDPSASGGIEGASAAAEIADARGLIGEAAAQAKRQGKPQANTSAAAATAADKPNGPVRTGGGGSGPSNLSLDIGKSNSQAATGGGSSDGPAPTLSVSGLPAQTAENAAVEGAKPAAKNTASGFAESGAGGTRGGGGKDNSNLFGGADGGTGPGLSAVGFGGKPGEGGLSDVDMDAYLERNSKFSLFEVVNKRMVKWGGTVEAERARAEFEKTSNR